MELKTPVRYSYNFKGSFGLTKRKRKNLYIILVHSHYDNKPFSEQWIGIS